MTSVSCNNNTEVVEKTHKVNCETSNDYSITTDVAEAKKGDTVIIIEAMKMEIPVVAPEDGTVASVDCKVGDAIDGGAVLATLN